MLRWLLIVFALLGAGVAFGAPGDPRYVPSSCAETHVDVFVSWVNGDERTDDGDPDGDGFTYVCNVGGVDYVMDVFHLAAAVSQLGAWADYFLDRVEQPGAEWYSERTPADKGYQLTFFGGMYINGEGQKYGIYRGTAATGVGTVDLTVVAEDRPSADVIAAQQYEEYLGSEGALFLGSALELAPSVVSMVIFKNQVGVALYGGLMDPDNLPPGVGGEPEEPGGPGSGGGDPNDPYRPGSQVGRCGQGEGLSWFEAAISRMFQPCEDWPAKWGALVSQSESKLPFGLASWVPYLGTAGAASPFDGERLLIGCRQVALVNASVYSCVAPIEILGHQVPSVRLSEVPGFMWWHETGRTWLFYLVVLTSVFALIKRVAQ